MSTGASASQPHGRRPDRPRGATGARYHFFHGWQTRNRTTRTGHREPDENIHGETYLLWTTKMGIRELLFEILTDEGTRSSWRRTPPRRAWRERRQPDLVLLDIWMPDTDGVTCSRNGDHRAADHAGHHDERPRHHRHRGRGDPHRRDGLPRKTGDAAEAARVGRAGPGAAEAGVRRRRGLPPPNHPDVNHPWPTPFAAVPFDQNWPRACRTAPLLLRPAGRFDSTAAARGARRLRAPISSSTWRRRTAMTRVAEKTGWSAPTSTASSSSSASTSSRNKRGARA